MTFLLTTAIKMKYHPLPEEDKWKGEMVDLMIEDLDNTQIDNEDLAWLEHLCSD